jgi:hypothetical protein
MLIELKGSAGDGLLSHSEFLAVRVDPALAQELLAAKVPFFGIVNYTGISPLLSWLILVMIFILVCGPRRAGQGDHVDRQNKAKVFVEKDITHRSVR